MRQLLSLYYGYGDHLFSETIGKKARYVGSMQIPTFAVFHHISPQLQSASFGLIAYYACIALQPDGKINENGMAGLLSAVADSWRFIREALPAQKAERNIVGACLD
jgi:hypothetical protein